ncbi:hypothetical protein HD554DRAFT_2316820 [Boletus coccyginus]|nr:hypothetical protein HD554DRAFT_2316820 [Boletus coccyginus]
MGEVVVDNSSVWFPVIEAIHLANWCDVAAVALVCYDSVLVFSREVEYIWRRRWSFMSTFYVIVRYLGIALALNFWALNANILMSPSVSLAVDRFANFGAFGAKVVGDVIMALRVYAMYLGSKIVLAILIAMILARIGLGLAISVIIFGPQSGISATEWILSGIHVCGPSVDTSGSLPLAWDILALAVNSILFLLAVGRFVKHAIDMRRMLHRWTFSDLMGVLVRDSIIYFLMNLLATIFLMISVWSIPSNSTYFAIISAYTQNEASVVIPRLVISFRENYDEDGQPSQHGGNAGHQTVRSDKMVFERRAMTDDFELQTVDRAQPPCVEESA